MSREIVTRTWRTWIVCMAVATGLTACGGGGGGSPPPLPLIADTAAAYWVSTNGAKWSYHLVDQRPGADPQPRLKTVRDLGDVVVAGRTVRQFEHSWSLFDTATETEYRYFDGQQIRSRVDAGVLFGVSFPAQDTTEVPAPLRDGETHVIFDHTEMIDVDGDMIADSVRIEVRMTIASVAALSVPAGDFRNLLRTHQTITATITLGGQPITVSATGTLTTWYAPGVGIVRRAFEDPEFAAPGNIVTEELVGVAAGTLRAGVVPENTGLDALGFGTDSSTPGSPGIAVGNAGAFMLVSESAAGNVEGAIVDGNGVQVWRGTVLAPSPPYRLYAPAVAFDGTDYRVVAARTIPFNSPSEFALIGQRIGSTGTLRDGAAGALLDSSVVDASHTLTGLRAAARNGQVLVAWGRYDPTYVEVAPGLVMPRGYVIEGRLFDAQQQPLAARFELGSGLPASMVVRGDQYLLVNASANPSVEVLNAWAIGAGGAPVSMTPQPLSTTPSAKGLAKLQSAGADTWLSFSEWNDVPGPPVASIVVGRLGLDGVLLDGTPAAPGRTLLAPDAVRGMGTLALGAQRSLLGWSEGWDSVRATLFDNTVLTGAAALPATSQPLVTARPLGAGPSRSGAFATDLGTALLVGWVDNEQSAATPSDRVMFTLIYPRYIAP